jgi:hypothetical protein
MPCTDDMHGERARTTRVLLPIECHVERERERERESVCVCVSVHVHADDRLGQGRRGRQRGSGDEALVDYVEYRAARGNHSAATPSVVSFVEDTHMFGQYAYGHVSTTAAPLLSFAVIEPPLGCASAVNPRERTSVTARSAHCVVAGNGGYFNMTTGTCLGNIVSDGRVVQSSTFANANFGLRASGTYVIGYISEAMVRDTVDPFVQLVAGVGWLVRNSSNYVRESFLAEDLGTQMTGNNFATIQSARTAIGHDAAGRLLMLHVRPHAPRVRVRCAALTP